MPREATSDDCLAVHVEDLKFSYSNSRDKLVLDGTNVAVDRGSIYGLLGPSGCGKTTLLQCIIGRYKPMEGSLKIYGRIPGEKGFSIPGPGVGFMPQELALSPFLTAEETMMFFGRLFQMERHKIVERTTDLMNFLDIPNKKKQIKYISGGERRRVSFAVAIIHNPPLLILDEPTVGVDPLLREKIWHHLQNLAVNDNVTIIITTHYIEEARQADVVGLMRDGRLLAEANPDLLMRQHSASTLEEVFLKLCNETCENGSVKEVEMDGVTSQNPCAVWVRHEGVKCHVRGSFEESKSKRLKTSLMDVSEMDGLETDPSWKAGRRAMAMHIFAFVSKHFVRMSRNVVPLLFQIFVPALLVIVHILCIGPKPSELPLSIVNTETDAAGKADYFLQFLDKSIINQKTYSNLSIAIESVKRGSSWGVIYIGPTFTDSLIDRYMLQEAVDNETVDDSSIKIYLDTTNQQLAYTILEEVHDSFQKFSEALLVQYYRDKYLATPYIDLAEPIYGDRKTSHIEFATAGLILGISFVSAIAISSHVIIREKKEGLLERSWIAGVQSWEVICSFLVILAVMMIIHDILVLVLAFAVFKITCRGNLLWIIISVLLVGTQGLSCGLFISVICDSEFAALLMALTAFCSNYFINGSIWPLESLPHYLRTFSYLLPYTAILEMVKSVMSRGIGITQNNLWVGYVIGMGWVVFFLLMSCIILRMSR